MFHRSFDFQFLTFEFWKSLKRGFHQHHWVNGDEAELKRLYFPFFVVQRFIPEMSKIL